METFLHLAVLCLLAFSISTNLTLIGKMKNLEAKVELLLQKKDDIHRSMLALREPLETTKPIKPNNWNSMKEAFKGPSRIEGNERN